MKKNISLAAIILAAGYSSRMEQLKPLLPMKKSLVIESAIDCFRHGGITDIRVVLGYRAGDIIPFLSRPGVRYIINGSFEQGMYSSIRAGIRDLDKTVEAFFLLPGDIPIIHSGTVRMLAAAYHDTKPRIIYPCFRGFRGHPPLISTHYCNEILHTEYPQGMQGLLARHESDAVDIEADDLGILIDINTPFEYRHLLDLNPSCDVPSSRMCHSILDNLNVHERIVSHSQKVAETATKLALTLNRHGFDLDITLIEASGLLHDVAKGQSRHDQAGRGLIMRLGYPKVAEIIGTHVDINLESREYLDEAGIVYLADKLVKDEHLVSLDSRFAGARERFKDNEEIIQAVHQRFENARTIRQRIEDTTGQSIPHILGNSSHE